MTVPKGIVKCDAPLNYYLIQPTKHQLKTYIKKCAQFLFYFCFVNMDMFMKITDLSTM